MSVATVSRAFYENAVIAPQTRERVLHHAAKIGFRPNPFARGLITKSSRIVGIVVSDIKNPFYPEVLTQLTEQLQLIGFSVMLVVVNQSQDEAEAVRGFLSYHPDLVIILATTLSSVASEACRSLATPVIFFNRHGSDNHSYAITCDNLRGGRDVADFLIDSGHKRPAFIGGRPDASTNVERWLAFNRRCIQRGLQAPLMIEGKSFSYEEGYAGALNAFDKSKKPDALFCANDILAIGALDAVRRKLGLSVPADLSIIGFDDIAMASWPSYSLTTIRQPQAQMIRQTTELALALSRHDSRAATLHQIPGKLVERSTTRPLKGKTKKTAR